jgi:opine dehydrogenase
MRIAVLGAGAGGCSVAFDFAAHGHQVQLFDFEEYGDAIAKIRDSGGIQAEGGLEGFYPIQSAGHDIERCLDGASIIFAVGPAYSTKPFAKACRPHLEKGQTVIVCPSSSGGAIEFKKEAGLELRDDEIRVAETSTLPYAVRSLEPGKVKIFLKLRGGLFIAALPSKNTDQVLNAIRDVYPHMTAAKNVLQTSLQNGNPIIHPAITLLNAALIERTAGDFLFYEEGVTPAVGRLIEAIDRERIAIGRALGVDILPDPELAQHQGYMTEISYDRGYSLAPGFKGIKAQTSLDYRYFNEDVGYGLVLMSQLGAQLGVETPHMSALIRLVSTAMNRDYLGEAPRTLESLGLSGYTAEQLVSLLE